MDKQIKEKIVEELLPHLEKLSEAVPQYGEIGIRAKICDYKIGTITVIIETSQKTTKITKGE
jgi:hypothetical protein